LRPAKRRPLEAPKRAAVAAGKMLLAVVFNVVVQLLVVIIYMEIISHH
jgi:hypothetical protein